MADPTEPLPHGLDHEGDAEEEAAACVSMVEAISAGDTAGVEALVRRHGGILHCPLTAAGVDASPLLLAVTLDREAVVRRMLDLGADVRSRQNWECLHCALGHDNMGIVRSLLAAGVAVDSYDAESTHTPLTRAVVARRADLLRLLLYVHADSNLEGYAGKTPLFLSHQRGWLEGFDLLLAAGASPYLPSKGVIPSLREAILEADSAWLQYVLDSIPDDPTSRPPRTRKSLVDHALVLGVQHKCPDKVSYLIRKGADVNTEVRPAGWTPASGGAGAAVIPGAGGDPDAPRSLLHVVMDCFKCRVNQTMSRDIRVLVAVRLAEEHPVSVVNRLVADCPCLTILYQLLWAGTDLYGVPPGETRAPLAVALRKSNYHAALVWLQFNGDPTRGLYDSADAAGSFSALAHCVNKTGVRLFPVLRICGLEANAMMEVVSNHQAGPHASRARDLLADPMTLSDLAVKVIRTHMRASGARFCDVMHVRYYRRALDISSFARDLILLKNYEHLVPGIVKKFDETSDIL